MFHLPIFILGAHLKLLIIYQQNLKEVQNNPITCLKVASCAKNVIQIEQVFFQLCSSDWKRGSGSE